MTKAQNDDEYFWTKRTGDIVALLITACLTALVVGGVFFVGLRS